MNILQHALVASLLHSCLRMLYGPQFSWYRLANALVRPRHGHVVLLAEVTNFLTVITYKLFSRANVVKA